MFFIRSLSIKTCLSKPRERERHLRESQPMCRSTRGGERIALSPAKSPWENDFRRRTNIGSSPERHPKAWRAAAFSMRCGYFVTKSGPKPRSFCFGTSNFSNGGAVS
jgi:hypothetical protein